MEILLAHAAGGHAAPAADTLTAAMLALVTLTAMEIVLGIDNIVFISIVVEKLEESRQAMARRVGLVLAMVMRIGLLLSIKWIMGLEAALFTIAGNEFSGRDLILLGGGLFLVGKATFEIHERIEGPGHEQSAHRKATASFAQVILQILMLDLVFSLDSVITAVGMADDLWVMIVAVVVAVGVMLVFAGYISAFIKRHPTLKMLALAFLILIGVMLLFEGFGGHINKGYIYFAMAFSLGVESLNLWAASRRKAAASAARGA
jgi:predicted tellurium resistance membrane protein TerC